MKMEVFTSQDECLQKEDNKLSEKFQNLIEKIVGIGAK